LRHREKAIGRGKRRCNYTLACRSKGGRGYLQGERGGGGDKDIKAVPGRGRVLREKRAVRGKKGSDSWKQLGEKGEPSAPG